MINKEAVKISGQIQEVAHLGPVLHSHRSMGDTPKRLETLQSGKSSCPETLTVTLGLPIHPGICHFDDQTVTA